MIMIPRQDYNAADTTPTAIPAGRYLAQIDSATEQTDYLLVRYRILAPRAGLVGEERFYMSPKAIKRLAILLKRIGLVDRGTPFDEAAQFDEGELAGKQLIVDIVNEEVQGKRGTYTVAKWDYAGFWRPDHPDVAAFVAALSREVGETGTSDDEV